MKHKYKTIHETKTRKSSKKASNVAKHVGIKKKKSLSQKDFKFGGGLPAYGTKERKAVSKTRNIAHNYFNEN